MIENNENINSGLKAWVALFRLPNLFTIPGDVVVGYLAGESMLGRGDLVLGYSVARGSFANTAFFPALISILSLYCYGLVSNDLADFKEDSVDRPERPLPSGRVSIKSARLAAGALLTTGLFSAKIANLQVFVMACALAVVVTGYNFLLKRTPIVGAVALAFCRVMALLSGFLACGIGFNFVNPPPFIIVACSTWAIYILSISVSARSETEPSLVSDFDRKVTLFIPYLQFFWILTAMVVGGGVVAIEAAGEVPPGIILALSLAVVFIFVGIRGSLVLASRNSTPEAAQRSVGMLIRGLIFLQASACAFLGYPYAAVIVGLLWIPAVLASGMFKGS